jgi:PAS domain S-box-containing protein
VSRSSLVWPSLPRVILYYAVAVLAIAAAVAAGVAADRFLQAAPFVSLFLCAVLFTAWLGGAGPGLFATGLSILAFHYFFIRSLDSLIGTPQDVVRLALFAIAALFVVWLSAAQKRTAESLRRARDELRETVRELEILNTSLKTENAERIRAEQTVRQAERQLQEMIDTIPAIAARYRPDGSLDFVNQTWRTYTGLSQDSLRGHRWGVAIHPDDLPRVEAAWRTHLPTGEPFQLEQRMRRADGEYRWHVVQRVPHRDEKGEVTGWYGVAHDIEDQRRAQEGLRRSERELRDLIETMPAMAVAALPDGSPTFVNRRWAEYTGLSVEDTLGSGWKAAIHPEDFERWLNLWRACLATGQPFEDEARFRRSADGEYRWFWTRGVALRDEQGNIAGWYGLGMDIQDRKYAEQERERLRLLERQAERELRITIDTIPAIVTRYRRDGSPDFVNQTWRTYTGLSNDSLQGQRPGLAVHPDDLPKLHAAWSAHLATGQPFDMEQRLRRADGEYRWFFVRRVPLRDENGQVIRWYAAAHDIDDQKRAERALRRSEAYLAEAQRLAHTGSWAIDYANRKPIHSSEEHHRLFAFDPAGGMPPWRDWMLRIHPEDRPMTEEIIERSSRERTDFEMDYRVCHPDGTMKYLQVVGHPILNAAGEVVEFVGTSVDVTERRQAEESRRDAQNKLAHANRVSTMGQLTASIAHEINQPIAAVVTNASAAVRFLDARPPDLREARQSLDDISRDGIRAGEIIHRIRALVEKVPPRKDRLDMNEAILEVVSLTRHEMVKNAVLLRTDLASGLPSVHGDRIQLQQVVLNLILNAVEAMGTQPDGTRELLIATGKDGAKGVSVAVRDSGPGLGPRDLEHLFDAFYSTKPGGMGMGLAICRSIIDAHGGRIFAAANVPRGADFRFTLPARLDPAS